MCGAGRTEPWALAANGGVTEAGTPFPSQAFWCFEIRVQGQRRPATLALHWKRLCSGEGCGASILLRGIRATPGLYVNVASGRGKEAGFGVKSPDENATSRG